MKFKSLAIVIAALFLVTACESTSMESGKGDGAGKMAEKKKGMAEKKKGKKKNQVGFRITPGSAQDLVVNVGDRVFYALNKSNLSSAARATLEKQAAWLKKYGVTNGTSAEDWIDDDFSAQDFSPYFWPSDQEQEKAEVKAVFLGHYFEWNPHKTFEIAKKYGFKADQRPKTGYYSFADIDDAFLITIHHWLTWYKFGFTRLWDNLSLEIRNGQMSRKEAIEIVRNTGEEIPREEISKFSEYVKIPEKRCIEIAESFRNHDIWKRNKNDTWSIEGFLIDEWSWT